MKIKVNRQVSEEVTLSDTQVKEIVLKFLMQQVSLGEYIKECDDVKYLMRDDPYWRHGSVDEIIVRKATKEDLLVFDVVEYIRNQK